MSDDNSDVVNLAEARQRKEKKPSRKSNSDTHVIVGTAVIEVLESRGEALLVTADQIWRYEGGLWSCPALDGRRGLEVEIETACHGLNLTSNNRLINETRQWILRRPNLYRKSVPWDAHGKVPTRSGLIDVTTLTIVPASREHYATWRIECDFVPEATCPWWEQMLSDFFADRAPSIKNGTIETIQEVLGTALIEDKSKAMTKALVLQGGSDSGKTSVLEVMSGLISDRPISMAMDSLGGTHGLMEFTRRAPWVLNEAFDQSKWHFSSLVKSILTGDPVQINVKNGPILTQRVKAPVFWGTNHPPQFKEATKAIVNRLIVIPCRQTFSEDNPVGAAREARKHGFAEPSRFILETEKPGLLNWAIVGLKRALERGHFRLTDEIVETRAEIRAESNLVEGFIRECVEFTEHGMVSTPDFCAAFTVWWQENKGENRGTPSNDSIGRAVSSLGEHRIGRFREEDRRHYIGIRLNAIGMDYWRGASASNAAQGKTARISSGPEGVNRTIKPEWDHEEAICRMREAFKKSSSAQSGMSPGNSVIGDKPDVLF